MYDATQNVNIPLAKRKQLVDQLQEQYPKYFGNIKDEVILLGGAKKAYESLTTAILNSAKAKAQEETLVDIQKQSLAVNQQISGNTAEQIKLQQQLNTLKQKSLTFEDARGVIQTTDAGKKANNLQNQLNGVVSKGNDLLKQRNELLTRANVISESLSKTVEVNPDILLDPTGDVKTPKVDKRKFEFLFDFLPFDPNGKLKPEQRAQLLDAIEKFQKEFGSIFKGLNISGDIEAAKEFDLKLKAGNIEFDTEGFRRAIEKTLKPEDLVPNITFQAFPKILGDAFKATDVFADVTQSFEQQVDVLKTRFLQAGLEIPKTFEGIDIFGNKKVFTFEDLFDTSQISAEKAIEAIKNALNNLRTETVSAAQQQLAAIQETVSAIAVEGFASIGEAVGAALTGGDIGKVFQNLMSFIGGSIADLGKQMIKMSPVIAALRAAIKTLNPALLLPAGIALVAIGSALRNIKPKGFAKGGWVPGQGSGDTVPAMLTPKEYVLTTKQAAFWVPIMKAVGEGFKMPKMINNAFHFQEGGMVPSIDTSNPLDRVKNNIISISNPEPVPYVAGFDISHDKARLWMKRADEYGNKFGR